jgi:CspA family cold shock protein
MQEGTVKFYTVSKGFDFINTAIGGADTFVYATGFIGQIHENDKVSFVVQDGKKALNAVNVIII